MDTEIVKQLKPSDALVFALDSDVSLTLGKLANYRALVSEVIDDEGNLEGTILYVPGISHQMLPKSYWWS